MSVDSTRRQDSKCHIYEHNCAEQGRIALITSTFSLALAVGVAGPAMAGSSNGPLNKPQTLSKADLNSGGANGQCPGGPYCSTRNGSPSLNGNGKGKAC